MKYKNLLIIYILHSSQNKFKSIKIHAHQDSKKWPNHHFMHYKQKKESYILMRGWSSEKWADKTGKVTTIEKCYQ